MELRQIEMFLAVADELHFGRAARRLHVAQPSVSQQLQRLEREVGVRLVDRDSHRVQLTAAGAAFQEQARTVHAQLDLATAAARAAADGRSGTVRLGFNFPSGRLVVPPLVRRLEQTYPALAVSLSEGGTAQQRSALLSGSLDVGFISGPADRPTLASRPLARVPMVVLVGIEHRLAAHARVSFADLAREKCIIGPRESSPATYDSVVDAASSSGYPLHVVEHKEDVGGTLVMVSTGKVVSFSTAIRGQQAASSGIVALPFIPPAPHVELHVAWRDKSAEPLVRNVLGLVHAR